MNLGLRVPMLLLAFIAGWAAFSVVSWLAGSLADMLPVSALPQALWGLSWLCVAAGAKYFAVGFVYVLGLRDDWRFAGAWTWIGTLVLSAFEGRGLGLDALSLSIGAAAAFMGAWLAQSRWDHPVVERMREAFLAMIPQG